MKSMSMDHVGHGGGGGANPKTIFDVDRDNDDVRDGDTSSCLSTPRITNTTMMMLLIWSTSRQPLPTMTTVDNINGVEEKKGDGNARGRICAK